MIRVENLSKKFGSETILSGISLELKEGEFVSLLGPSGCGKTTLLRSIAGFESPDQGEIQLDGTSILNVRPQDRPFNMVFQKYALFPHMSVFQNVEFGLVNKKVPEGERKKRVEEMLDAVGLSSFAKRSPNTLSGGQQQRVALARALVNHPRLLLLDEPMSALDLKLREKMQLELHALQRKLGLTFLLVTHDQTEALTLSDRIAVMNAGKIEQFDTAFNIYENPKTAFVAEFIGAMNFFKRPDGSLSGIRPERIRLTQQNGQSDALRNGQKNDQRTAKIHKVLFRGQSHLIWISPEDWKGEKPLLEVVLPPHESQASSFREGDLVHYHFDANDERNFDS